MKDRSDINDSEQLRVKAETRDAGRLGPGGMRAIQGLETQRPVLGVAEKTELDSAAMPRLPDLASEAGDRGKVSDRPFIDKQGRLIALRSWESDQSTYVRAYDTSKTTVPDRINLGQAGHAEGFLEQGMDGKKALRLGYIETQPEYRNAGISGQMLEQVEQYGKQHGAGEVFGVVENEAAQSFWKAQETKGWKIDPAKGAYGEVRKTLVD
jgi:GNAT superfamily N-acetyltransferase